MKKRKIILCVILILIVVLIAGWYELCQYEVHIGVITSINNTRIEMISSDLETYRLSIEKTSCKDNKGKKIEVTDLKEGDTIKIINRKETIIPSIYPISISNVKSIKVLGSNLQTLSKYLTLISLNDSKECSLSDLEWISLLRLLNSISSTDSIKKELPKERDYKYIPKGNSNYQYEGKVNTYETIIEIFDNEICIIENSYWDFTQTITKISDERCNQLKDLLDKCRKGNS